MNQSKSGPHESKEAQKHSPDANRDTRIDIPVTASGDDEQSAENVVDTAENEPSDSQADKSDETLEGLQYKIAVLSEALESAKDKTLRAQAEAENIRRRSAIEQLNSRKFAIENFASELLSVKDSLDLAQKVELSAENEDVISKMQEGLSLTLKQLEHIFEKFSISMIAPEKGEKLNPELHQAMTIVSSDEVDPNCIVDVVQKGYLLHDRLLRPAMVIIAKKSEQKSTDNGQ